MDPFAATANCEAPLEAPPFGTFSTSATAPPTVASVPASNRIASSVSAERVNKVACRHVPGIAASFDDNLRVAASERVHDGGGVVPVSGALRAQREKHMIAVREQLGAVGDFALLDLR